MKRTKKEIPMANVVFQVQIPEKYTKVYILGTPSQMGRWQTYGAKRMTRVGKSNVYEITLEVPLGRKIEYKYLHKRDWTGVECDEVGTELKNRKFIIEKKNYFGTRLVRGIDTVGSFRKMSGDKGDKPRKDD